MARRAQLVGLGLIGCSIGLGLRAAGWELCGNDRDPRREERALELGVIDRVGVDQHAELAIIATPVASIAAIAAELFSLAKEPLVVTDVGSVKAPVATSLHHPRFVGGHPMAGSEQEGPDGADGELFLGATWVLTPTKDTDAKAYSLVRAMVISLGADVLELTPEQHDSLVAVVSHVPHLTAANLMAVAADASLEHAGLLRLAAGGFRDMTRIAAGDPAIWPDIFADNKAAVLAVLDALRARLDEARRIVSEEDRPALVELLEYAKAARRNLPARVLRPEAIVECRIPVPDRPGVLAEVTTELSLRGVNVWDLEIAHSAEGVRGVLVLSISAEFADLAREALVARGYRPSMRSLS